MLLELVEKRRSIRKFTDEEVSEEDLREILNIALHAPTAKHRNSVRYIIIRDKKRLEELSHYKKNAAAFLSGANVAIAVLTDSEIAPNTNHQDASIAATFILLAAADLDLGATWANVADAKHESGITAQKFLHEFFGLEDKFDVECVIGIGHPAEEKSEKVPFEYKEVVFEDLNDKVK
ncbi:MAG: nitroreductase family protein [Peptoniphilus sp.]|uniref:nitroreductase family protein n=1 Tax=Peptoniphilus sp. TaxID=1971214 RepID=UPI0025FEF3C8|nr:nitroreductase family protein [Peptoniphilus sp.]MCI5643181.1 nitroreductase family protein [Peptoniphilus sp.]MDD7352335.1 nitroreductase family protein [Peptoniphilaceae bacterium]MDY3903391.1 nitroreductase family protein [Peptoniphilus sp.]